MQLHEYIQNNSLHSTCNGTLRSLNTDVSLPVASGSGRAVALSEPSLSIQDRLLCNNNTSMRRGFASTGIQLQQQQEKAEDEQDKKGPAAGHALSLPETLEYHGTPSVPTVPDDASIFKKAVLWMGGYYSKQSTYMRAAGELNVCIKEQSLNPALFQGTYSCCCLTTITTVDLRSLVHYLSCRAGGAK